MKRITLLLTMLIGLFALSVNAQQVERNMVVLEIATGTWCYYCPGAAMGADDLIDNGKDVAVIEYHNGDSYTNAFGNSRNSYNNVGGGIPSAMFDGVLNVGGGMHATSMYSYYLPKYNQRKAIMSSFTIDVVGETAGFVDYFTEITIEKVADNSSSDIRLHLVLTESGIEQNWQGMTELNFVERLMVPDQYGTSLDFSTEDTHIVNLDFSVINNWEYENCEIVVFLQDNTTHEILQGFKMLLTEFGAAGMNDLSLIDLRNIPEGNCSGVLSPQISVKSYSETEITQFDINYSVNGEELNTVQWTGTLDYLEIVDVDLPEIEFNNQENNLITVYTSDPNGEDDDFHENDTLKQDFKIAMSVEQTINMMLRMDDNPEEISWELKNSADEVIYSGDSYTIPGQNITEVFQLDAYECYSFTIYDAAGTGLESNGFFILYYGEGTMILDGSDFGRMLTTEFTTGWVGIDENEKLDALNISPNPFSDKANITFSLNSSQYVKIDIYDIYGNRVNTIDKGVLSMGSQVVELDGQKLTTGIYFIRMSINGKLITKKIVVN